MNWVDRVVRVGSGVMFNSADDELVTGFLITGKGTLLDVVLVDESTLDGRGLNDDAMAMLVAGVLEPSEDGCKAGVDDVDDTALGADAFDEETKMSF